MAGTLLRRTLLLLTAVQAWTCLAFESAACPFCEAQGQTLTQEVNQASLVLFGTLKNGNEEKETTELHVEAVIKGHEILDDKKVVTTAKDKKVIILNRYVPDLEGKYKFLVFCDVFQGKIDAYGGKPVLATSDIDKYLQGALALQDKEVSKRLRFAFDYLDNPDPEVSGDAYKEFANADYKDYRDLAKELPADKVAGWLEDPKTAPYRYGLYASMLGHCGKEKHAQLLRDLLEDPNKRVTSGVDGILAAYTMLKPKDGWTYLRSILKDPDKEFLVRYAALRSVRFFWEYRSDVVDKKELAEAMGLLLDQNDIADLAIEDLRKWKVWDLADRIVELWDKKSHDVPIIKRSIVRYALSCPQECKATVLLKQLRAKDPEMVKDAEEILKLESPPPRSVDSK
jgi:hypothetical protein